MNTHFLIAARACVARATAVFSLFLIGACSSLPQPPQAPRLYDLGPGMVQAAPLAASALPALALAEIDVPGEAASSRAMLYRLGYADAQQLRAYQQARWSQPPAVLLQQRLRERLGAAYSVLDALDRPLQSGGNARPPVLRLSLEEFSQLFASPERSSALLRLRATLVQPQTEGERLLGQRVFVLQQSAPSADAAGGAQALSAATEALAQELQGWLQSLQK